MSFSKLILDPRHETPRRSQRLSDKYSLNVPLLVSTRPSLSSYQPGFTNVLNESGQSVPSSFDSNVSLDTETSIQHDHTYSIAREHMHSLLHYPTIMNTVNPEIFVLNRICNTVYILSM